MFSQNWPRQGQTLEEICAPENNLETLRSEIDEIDLQMTALLARRFEISQEIGRTKQALGRNIVDESREQKVLDRVSGILQGQSSNDFILRVFKSIMKESAEHQKLSLAIEENRGRGERLFTNVCVIGVGLIGGSIARKIKSVFPNTSIAAIELPEFIDELESSKIFSECSAVLSKNIIEKSSLILLACPPEVGISVLTELAPLLDPGQVVVDLCSVKGNICKAAENLELNGAEFIGGHPFFGTEKSGFRSSAEVPMSGKTVCLVPTSKSSELSIARLKLWFSAMDFKVFVSDADSHDATVAVTSHLIQLIASALGEIIHDDILDKGKGEHLVLSGGALAGLSRLMASRPDMWAQITEQNRAQICDASEKLISRLQELLQNPASFEETFAKAAKVKSALE